MSSVTFAIVFLHLNACFDLTIHYRFVLQETARSKSVFLREIMDDNIWRMSTFMGHDLARLQGHWAKMQNIKMTRTLSHHSIQAYILLLLLLWRKFMNVEPDSNNCQNCSCHRANQSHNVMKVYPQMSTLSLTNKTIQNETKNWTAVCCFTKEIELHNSTSPLLCVIISN